MSKDNGGPAFPIGSGDMLDPTGMTLRAYAAIKLRQFDSGIDWLDEMIYAAKRDELAGQALAGLATSQDGDGTWMYGGASNIALEACAIADALLDLL